MTDPLRDRDALDDVLRLVAEATCRYLGRIDDAPVRPVSSDPGAALAGPLPSSGSDALEALGLLLSEAEGGATRSAGPRFFHFVMGGGTPASLAADWLTSALDQIAFNWVSSPLAMRVEQITIDWLKELFGLPPAWSGVLTSGATMANFTCLATARRWWGGQHGVDVEAAGLAGLPPVCVLSSGYIHASALKALGQLGIGRAQARTLTADESGRIDLAALEAALANERAGPAIVIATAGEPNAGAFDPIADMADLAEAHGAWLHVDAAFGLFAALTPSSRDLVRGIERARSVSVDGHKWLNVPYDCGIAFIDDPILHRETFSAAAAYLGSAEPDRPVFGDLAPEMSRRARALPVWATLRAYGRDGYRAMVERHLGLARRLADQIDAEADLERLADVALNVVCFRYHPRDVPDTELDALNRRIGGAVLEDGQIYFGTTVYAGHVAFRPAIVNWRTQPQDVDLIVPTVLRLGTRLRARTSR